MNNKQPTGSKTKSLLRGLIGPLFLILVGIVLKWWVSISFDKLAEGHFQLFETITTVIIGIGSLWILFAIIDGLTRYITHRTSLTGTQLDPSLAWFISGTLKILISLIVLVVIVSNLGYDVTGLVAGLGIGGLAIALAAQESIASFFASITIFADRPFRVGEYVIIGDIEGTIESVGFRSTRVRTFYNSLVTIPNSELIKQNINNMGAREFRRIKTTISITYETPPEKIEAFCAGIRELVSSHPLVDKDRIFVSFKDFAAYSLDIQLIFHVKVLDYEAESRIRHQCYLDIVKLASAMGVEFAYPTNVEYQGERITPVSNTWDAATYPQASSTETDNSLKITKDLIDARDK